MLAVVDPVALDEQAVVLLNAAALLHHVVKAHECLAASTDDDGAGGLAVEPVGKLKKGFVGTRGAQALDETVRNARAAVGGNARRLVDKMSVLVQDGNRPFSKGHGRRPACGLLRNPDRRHAQQVALDELRLRLDARLVDAHLTSPDDAVDVAFGHALGNACKIVVDTLAVRIRADRNPVDAVSTQRRDPGRRQDGNFRFVFSTHRLYLSAMIV